MNDTTRPPEESDDHAGVATGQQAAASDPAAKDAAPAASPDGNGAAGAAGRSPRPGPAVADGNGREADPAGSGPAGSDPVANADAPTATIWLPKPSNGSAPDQQPGSGVADPGAGSSAAGGDPTGPNSAAPDSPGAPAAGPGQRPATTDSGGPTGSIPNAATSSRPDTSASARPRPNPAASGPIPAAANSGGPNPATDGAAGTRPEPEPRTPAAAAEPVRAMASPTAPATGPTPIPGSAASPPPWNRVPGRGPQPAERPAPPREPPGPAGGLLDDGPTAYLMPDSGPAVEAAEPQARSWSPMRAGRTRPPRRAALQLKRLDPWSMLKLGLVLAVVIFFIWLVAVGVLYGVLDGMGVWDRLNGTYADLVSGEAPTGSPLISAGRVFGLAAVIGAINSLLFAVAVTIGAFVYNVSADLVGGIEVTLSERD